ncbi:LGFP repeat-containing protein [Algoriphagus pacificus]|uniref:LGFP repeat-containing protein n=1 Tax=Algoriphagus pacificus TaxID=2811234 RepID=A0ABS3CF87_9BACT|nr:hypothetical protein [Algoriphagus pacificus]MBN7814816.1 hypothetical protein [Algoriphagus pacificus]
MSKFKIDPQLQVQNELLEKLKNLQAIPVHPITTKYWSLGGSGGWLGTSTTGILKCPDGIGSFQHYVNGSIYYHPSTGAHEVHGLIRARWKSLGWERSFLGYPKTDETATPDGIGRFNHFQGGSIYWSPSTGAWEVHGAIRSKYSSLGWERSFLRYPLTNETTCPDGVGRFNHFQGGSIYWTPSTGAHEVHGAIRSHWASLGWERSPLGYPTSDELVVFGGDGRISHFQHGSIYWSSTAGVRVLKERIRVHVKILTMPTRFTINEQFAAMQEVYAMAGIRVDCATTENLNLPSLADVDVGGCTMGSVTAEQITLFGNRNFVGSNDVVVYFVNSTVPGYNGCAAYPSGRPGCVVVRTASRWTLGHEFGHVLGLNHVNNNDRLMTGNGTFNITNPPPNLTSGESSTMRSSGLSTNL